MPGQRLDGRLGELGYFTPSLSCRRRAMEKDEVRAASVALRGLNFRLGKKFHEDLSGKMRLERRPQPAVPLSSDNLSSMERRFQLLDEYLQRNPCINRAQYARLTGRSYKQAVNDLNQFIRDGVLVRYGMGRNVVYAGKNVKMFFHRYIYLCLSIAYLLLLILFIMTVTY